MEVNSIKEKIKANIIPVVVVGLGMVLIVGGLIYSKRGKGPELVYEQNTWNDDGTLKAGANCKTDTETVTVPASGDDIFEGGSEIKVELNYYACNKGTRNDIVMIKSPGRPDPIFKYIKMLPGDKYSVVGDASNKKFKVVVNGDDMENSKGEAYTFTDRKSRMIKLYESNFKEGIKQGVYFVFGESPAGGFDSTRFGPVTAERMVGKVLTQAPTEKK